MSKTSSHFILIFISFIGRCAIAGQVFQFGQFFDAGCPTVPSLEPSSAASYRGLFHQPSHQHQGTGSCPIEEPCGRCYGRAARRVLQKTHDRREKQTNGRQVWARTQSYSNFLLHALLFPAFISIYISNIELSKDQTMTLKIIFRKKSLSCCSIAYIQLHAVKYRTKN